MKVAPLPKLAFFLLCLSCLLFILLQDFSGFYRFSWWSWSAREEVQVSRVQTDQDQDQEKKFFKLERKFSMKTIDELAESSFFKEMLTSQHSTRLLYLNNLTFTIEPEQLVKCDTTEEHQKGFKRRQSLLIVVNSKWSNFDRRQRLRQSWLNPDNIQRQICEPNDKLVSGKFAPISTVRYLFAIGKSSDHHEEAKLDTRVLNESNQYRDLLVINLEEQYRSMSVKHLSIFKWILKMPNNNKPEAKFKATLKGDQESSHEKKYESFLRSTLVLKCDDDAQVNLSQLIGFYREDKFGQIEQEESELREDLENDDDDAIRSNFEVKQEDGSDKVIRKQLSNSSWAHSRGWIMCASFPQNTPVLRRLGRKWRLTHSEYHFDTFPAYCSGLAYLMPLFLLRRLLLLSHILLWNESKKEYMKPLWVDDVFITGILFSALIESDRARIVRLNAHFCYTRAHQARRAQLNAPCMVSELQ